MNIGILTYAGGLNYGAQAQLYAMTNYLKEKGHNITVLMFKPKKYKNCIEGRTKLAEASKAYYAINKKNESI